MFKLKHVDSIFRHNAIAHLKKYYSKDDFIYALVNQKII